MISFRLRLDYPINLHLRLSVNKIKFCEETRLISGRYKGNDDEANYSLKQLVHIFGNIYTFSKQSIRRSSVKFGLNLPVIVSQSVDDNDILMEYTNLSMRTYKVYPSVCMQISENVVARSCPLYSALFRPFKTAEPARNAILIVQLRHNDSIVVDVPSLRNFVVIISLFKHIPGIVFPIRRILDFY